MRQCFTQRLSVCRLATSRENIENYRSDLHENYTTDVSLDKEVPIKFWKLSGCSCAWAEVCVLSARHMATRSSCDLMASQCATRHTCN